MVAPAAATASAVSMICFSLSTEHGPAQTMNSSPPISTPFTRIAECSFLNSRLTNLYGAEMRTARSTPGVASSDSRQAVTSPTPTTPMTTRSSPSMEWTLYPNSRMRSQTWSISWRVAWGRMEMIMGWVAFGCQLFALYTLIGGICYQLAYFISPNAPLTIGVSRAPGDAIRKSEDPPAPD